jgi:galactokinase
MRDDQAAIQLPKLFLKRFHRAPHHLVNAPGRINLIGEHMDYCGGWVLPFASNLSIAFAASPRRDREVVIYFSDLERSDSFSLDDLSARNGARPTSYIKGVCWALEEAGYQLKGMDLAVASDLPREAGMSSSAALELGTCLCAELCSRFKLDPESRALICHRAEMDFVGVKCGIMDQFASSLGRAGKAILLDCLHRSYEYIPLHLSGTAILVCDSRQKRELSDSAYNQRRKECEKGIRLLMESQKLPSLDKLRRMADQRGFPDVLPPPYLQRVHHFLTENARVLEAAAALRYSDIKKIGGLLYQSHCSLRDHYEVSTPNLDFLVESAMSYAGVMGSRLMGAGFGGCTLTLLEESKLEEFECFIFKQYRLKFGLEPIFYRVFPASGAHGIISHS